jgi:dATP pyrophosphohydrolase
MADILVRVIDTYVFRHKEEGPRFLLLKRSKTKMYEHLWQGVAGKIKKGENAWEAAIRELKEETGLEPVSMFVADHVSRFYEVYGNRVNLVPVFGIEVDQKEVKLSEEHCEYCWVDLETAKDTLVWKGQKEGIVAVDNMLNSQDGRIKWSEVDLNTKGAK